METGKVKFFDSLKGYGFITSDVDGKDYFFGVNDMVDTVSKGRTVYFEVVEGKRGPKAISVVERDADEYEKD